MFQWIGGSAAWMKIDESCGSLHVAEDALVLTWGIALCYGDYYPRNSPLDTPSIAFEKQIQFPQVLGR